MSKVAYKKLDFSEIIDKAQNGDISALEELIKRIQQDVFAMFTYLTEKKQDISDLTQEALIRIAKGIKNLRDVKSFKSWINHIVTNVFYDYVKKQSGEAVIDLDDDKLLEFKDKIGCEPGEKCLFTEIDKLIQMALINLPHDLRIVIILREYEGLSYSEISDITKSSLGTVKSRLARARQRLQKQLIEFI